VLPSSAKYSAPPATTGPHGGTRTIPPSTVSHRLKLQYYDITFQCIYDVLANLYTPELKSSTYPVTGWLTCSVSTAPMRTSSSDHVSSPYPEYHGWYHLSWTAALLAAVGNDSSTSCSEV